MKRTEQILALLSIVAVSLKLFDIAGSFLLSTIFILIIAFFHYCLGFAILNNINFKNIFKKNYYQEKNINTKKIIVAISLGWSLSIIEIAILFNLAYWPGAEEIMWIGIIATLISGVIFTILNRKNKLLVRTNLYRMLIVLIVGFIVINRLMFF